MRTKLSILIIFVVTFLIYFGVASNFSFKPRWALDYFNPLAKSLLDYRLDLVNPSVTYDLVNFMGKWYMPWGILPALVLVPIQAFLGRFIPSLYLTLGFASLDVAVVYLLLLRLKKEFFPNLSHVEIYLLLGLFAFGTTHFYVGTLGSVWHVDQMVTNFLGTLGIYVIFKKQRQLKDYVVSAWILSLALLGRATIILLMVFPICLYLWQFLLLKKFRLSAAIKAIGSAILIFGIPIILFTSLFFLYNYLRFYNPFEYGYQFIQESPYLQQIRETNGIMSLKNMPRNLWYMLFEIPNVGFTNKINLGLNLNGNSIFFLTPPLLAAFLANPFSKRKRIILVDPYIFSLWMTVLVTLIPSLMIYSTGWMQFGFRYSLDITMLLLILSIFGMQGELNILYRLGILFSVVMQLLGIKALM